MSLMHLKLYNHIFSTHIIVLNYYYGTYYGFYNIMIFYNRVFRTNINCVNFLNTFFGYWYYVGKPKKTL